MKKMKWDTWLNELRKYVSTAGTTKSITFDSQQATKLYDSGLSPQEAGKQIIGSAKVVRMPKSTLSKYSEDVAERLKAEDYQGVIDEDTVEDAYNRGAPPDEIADTIIKNAAFDGMSELDEWEEEEDI